MSLLTGLCIAQAIPGPRLDCVIANVTHSANTLTWDAVSGQPCGPFISYQIYSSTSRFGPFTLDTTITDQSATGYVDTRLAGSTIWYYFIKDSFACPGATYGTSDTIENESNPAIPAIVNVTVNPDSSVTFTWRPSTSPQTKFYVVYIITPNGTLIPVDTIGGRFNTTYIDTVNNPYASTILYTIAAGDSCPGHTLSSYNTHPAHSILLSYSSARCNPTIPLSWTSDSAITGGLRGYQLYVSRNDSAYILADTFDNVTTNFNYANFDDGDSLQMHIVAVNSDSTVLSSSEYIRFKASVEKPPSYVYITHLSVDTTSNAVDLTWVVDTNAKLFEYEMYNSQDGISFNTVPNSSLGVQQVPLPKARFTSNADSTVTPQYYPYFYEIQAFDSCVVFTQSPDPAEIISLQGTLSDYYQITLSWNKFQLYAATVLKYDLYRDYGTGMQLIHTFDPTGTAYIDSVFSLLDQAGEFCYVIQATYHLVLPKARFDSILVSSSNLACIDHRPIIYIPNAFVWNGVNNFFKPRIIFGDPAGYDMTIWDRYGGKIFETHDPNGSWDGTNGGHPVDQGGYPYLIQFTALDGTAIERKGIVLFIKK